MKRENLLILFSKWPIKGNSKSRIAYSIGEGYIEDFCFACLDDLINKIKELKGIDLVIVPNTLEESFLFIQRYNVFSLSLEQIGIDSNLEKNKMFENVFNYFLRGYNKVSLIPMDIPHINKERIEESFKSMDEHNCVFGPETNGGVYLMGVKESATGIFKNVRWSTENSFNDLIGNCDNPARLEAFFDLNTIRDMAYLNKQMLEDCPALTRFIKSLTQRRIIMEKEAVLI